MIEKGKNMIDFVKINGFKFTVRGYSRKADEMHLNIRLEDGQTITSVPDAVNAGNAPLEFYDENGNLAAVFDGYTELNRYAVNYKYEFGIDDFGIAFQAVITKPTASATEITDLQMALAELAEMIAGGNNNG